MPENRYIIETPLNHRKTYGQFFTPAFIAKIMIKWILGIEPRHILDPAFGLGVFYEALNQLNSQKYINFTGYEIDERILSYINLRKNDNLIIHNSDYLESKLSRYDGIICNPPYMRFQKFLKRHDILPNLEKQIGVKLLGYANIASIFLVKSIKELNINGRLAYIMPFEFFNAGYGKEIKRILLENNLLKQIVIFDNEKDIFPDAITTVCILFCENNNQDNGIKITSVAEKDELDEIHDIGEYVHETINASDLPINTKWTPVITNSLKKQPLPEDFCNFSLYGAFKRGIATGANDFFALNKSKIEAYGLSENNMRKCITKSVQIRKSVFTESDFQFLFNADKPVFCLDVADAVDDKARNYIELGERLGYHKKYLTRNRNPWYKLEQRKPAPILFGVFNRGRLKVIRNLTDVINFTCYHSFYPNMFGRQFIDKIFIYLLSDIGQKIIGNNKRSYGDKLDKFEPNDLNECSCPNMEQFEKMDNEEVERIIDIAITDIQSAIHLSNQLISQTIPDYFDY